MPSFLGKTRVVVSAAMNTECDKDPPTVVKCCGRMDGRVSEDMVGHLGEEELQINLSSTRNDGNKYSTISIVCGQVEVRLQKMLAGMRWTWRGYRKLIRSVQKISIYLIRFHIYICISAYLHSLHPTQVYTSPFPSILFRRSRL